MKFRTSACLSIVSALGFLVFSACSEAPTAATDSHNENTVLGKKPNCQDDPSHPSCADDGGGDSGGDNLAMYANLIPSSSLHANELVDASGSGGRLGTGWTTGFGLVWSGSGFERGPDDAASDACPGINFGLLEGNTKGGDVASVWLRGYRNGVQYSSKRTDVSRQAPSDTGWTLEIRQDMDIYEGNGSGNGTAECTVYVNDVEFVPVNP
jgi:hypothetical protein